MKYKVKKFNESDQMPDLFLGRGNNPMSIITKKFKNWIADNLKYNDDDILYYFSEFTDEYEYYFSQHGWYNEGNDLKECYDTINFNFSKTRKKSIIETYIDLGNELKVFKKCLHQFANIEEININDDSIKVSVDHSISIKIRFDRHAPKEIIDQFMKEYWELKKNK